MTDPTDSKQQQPATPDPQIKETTEGSAPVADPVGLVKATAQPADPRVGGSQTEPTATQEAAPRR